jgi:hypothetical protein
MVFSCHRAALVGALALASTTGCAAQNAELRKNLGDLKREVVALQAANSAMRERLDALEQQTPPHSTSASASAAARDEAESSAAEKPAKVADRPALSVVRLGPEPAGDGWTPIDPSDPRRPKLAPHAAADDGAPAMIRSDRTGNVIQEPSRPQVAQRK